MKKRTASFLIVLLLSLVTLVFSIPIYSQSPTSDGLRKLKQDAGDNIEITWNPQTGTASFVRGRIPLAALGLRSASAPATSASAVLDRYGSLFGVKDSSRELKSVETRVDELGMTHVTQAQVYQGVEVYNSLMKIHLSADSREVVAINSGFIPGIQLSTVYPRVSADQAKTTANKDLPKATLVSSPKLVVYPGSGNAPGASAKLAWSIELRDYTIPARNVYFVDAIDGSILHVLSRMYE